jgi:hypothetical protein
MFYDDDYDDPGTYSDADIEQAEMEAEGRRLAALRRQGICTHGSVVGYHDPPIYPEQEGLKPGQERCTAGCGRVFDSDDDWIAAIRDL